MKRIFSCLLFSVIIFSACTKDIDTQTDPTNYLPENFGAVASTAPRDYNAPSSQNILERGFYYLDSINEIQFYTIDEIDTNSIFYFQGPLNRKTYIHCLVDGQGQFYGYTRSIWSPIEYYAVKITFFERGDTLFFAEVDANNRVIYSRWGKLDGTYFKGYYYYDSKGKLIRTIHKERHHSSSPEIIVDNRYEYDWFGNIIKVKRVQPLSVVNASMTFTYDYSKPLINADYPVGNFSLLDPEISILRYMGFFNLNPYHLKLKDSVVLPVYPGTIVTHYFDQKVNNAGNLLEYKMATNMIPLPTGVYATTQPLGYIKRKLTWKSRW
jgi:hypothetical protein